jgi:outer membrane protein assembly factor BamB
MVAHGSIRGWVVLGLLLAGASVPAQENWPQWRGPDHNGVSTSTGLPVTWSESENIVWKAALPSWSGGSPVIWGDRVFVTSASKAAEASAAPGRHPGGEKLLLLCLSKKDGSVLWERELDGGNKLSRKQNDSSPSPVTDGERVWVMTGSGTLTALDLDGNPLWKRNIQEDYGPFGLQFGYASSPILYEGLLIVQVLHGFRHDDPSYLVAFDAATGKPVWREERWTDAIHECPDAYTTPTLSRVGDRLELVVSGGDYVTGHDPSSGKELWRAAGLNPGKSRVYRIIASPVAVDGMVYAPTRKKPLLALRAGGTGDVTTSHLAWKWDEQGGPDVPTPACDGKRFYMVDDRGLATCLDAKTGAVIWGPERVLEGIVSASPLLADDKLYATDEKGVTAVMSAGDEFKLLAKNDLKDEYTLSSMAVSGNRLFLRTSSHLYCIGEN